ncbi:TRAP transporter large permease [Aurantimonas sp. DM33-3]|uniref:TRAP transporter large permease n=1 Tax=Aurantimonas sp. DM33-3 TaxID=2766955 RepID=UPI001652372A|nr:TRAP transporter large permease [Aurantimonas sp. DM33-3]MBC6718701.1 TRAP transporter large permease [Aurantimonas sp. DM33-3]
MVPAAFFLLLLAGVPIALVLALTAAIYIGWSGNTLLFQSFPQQLYGGLEKYGLLAIPLFMLVGELMNEGGITKRLIALAGIFVGSLKGGLAYINLVANMFMASIIGSTNAQIAVMGHVMVPEMERRGYNREFAAAVTAAGGLMAPIIPPSMLFVIYGVLAQISIGDMFIAGILPGLLMGALFIGVVALMGFFYEYPRGDQMSRHEAWRALLGALPSLSIPVVIIGGIAAGIATPTESAALAAVAAIVVGASVHREFRLSQVAAMMTRLVANSATVLFLVATANVFGWIVVYEKVPQTIAAYMQSLTNDPFVFLLLLNLLLLVVGCVIDAIAALILIVPIVLPIAVAAYGIDPFHFGVVICLNLVLGLLTPPVGTGLFVAASVSGCKATDIVKPLAPFLLATILVIVLLAWQPVLTTLFIQ